MKRQRTSHMLASHGSRDMKVQTCAGSRKGESGDKTGDGSTAGCPHAAVANGEQAVQISSGSLSLVSGISHVA
jgi:hypothetical protein